MSEETPTAETTVTLLNPVWRDRVSRFPFVLH